MSEKTYVSYLRVSTKQQGQSGNGLEAQRQAIKAYTDNCGCCVLGEYIEVESGKNDNRQQLSLAIDHAQREGATLLIAKLDRLSRNASFILKLRDSGVEFVCCDMPDANHFTIGIFALLAQQEREMISKRTKEGIQARIRTKGNWDRNHKWSEEAREKSKKTRIEAKEKYIQEIADIFALLIKDEMGHTEMSNWLNKNKYRTRRGNKFYPKAVKRTINDLEVRELLTEVNMKPTKAKKKTAKAMQ